MILEGEGKRVNGKGGGGPGIRWKEMAEEEGEDGGGRRRGGERGGGREGNGRAREKCRFLWCVSR